MGIFIDVHLIDSETARRIDPETPSPDQTDLLRLPYAIRKSQTRRTVYHDPEEYGWVRINRECNTADFYGTESEYYGTASLGGVEKIVERDTNRVIFERNE